MTRVPHLLVVEGNTPKAREQQAASMGHTYSQAYSDVLHSIAPHAAIDVCFPADISANIPDPSGLEGYDGVVITGSSLNLYKAERESLLQVDLVRAVFAVGVPMFGSCWGLQVATVAAGGTVVLATKGREIGLARKIVLTTEGRDHPMFAGKPLCFDAPAVHTDEVGEKPPGMTVTAANAHSQVQAAEVRHGAGVLWGVQYHPEFSLHDLAAAFIRYGKLLVDEGPFRNLDDLEKHVVALKELETDPSRKDIAWRLGYDSDVLDPARRLTEIRNFIERLVLPSMSVRGRE